MMSRFIKPNKEVPPPEVKKMNKVKGAFDKVVEWDKALIKKCQDKWGLTDYQIVCISFAKGFVIGAILL